MWRQKLAPGWDPNTSLLLHQLLCACPHLSVSAGMKKYSSTTSKATSDEDIELLSNPAFGKIIHTIKGANVDGVRNSLTIYEKGAEMTRQHVF